MRTTLLALTLALAVPAAAAEPEERLAPALYAGLSFGGATGIRDPRVGLRLDAQAARATDAPPLMHWELRSDMAEFAIAGRPLLSHSLLPAYQEGEPAVRSSRLTWGLLAVAAGAAVTAVALGEAEEAFGEAAGEGAENAALTVLSGGQADGDEPAPPPCDGVEVVDNCVGD